VQGEIISITIGSAAWEVGSSTWNLGTSPAFALRPRKTTEHLDLVGRSQDLPDAKLLLVSSPALNPRTLTVDPNLCYCVFLFRFSFIFFPQQVVFYNYLYVHVIWISTKPYITHMEEINAYENKYAYKYTYICICVSLTIVKFGSLLQFENIGCFTRFVAYNKDYVSQLRLD
jgi:hypothetical protein